MPVVCEYCRVRLGSSGLQTGTKSISCRQKNSDARILRNPNVATIWSDVSELRACGEAAFQIGVGDECCVPGTVPPSVCRRRTLDGRRAPHPAYQDQASTR